VSNSIYILLHIYTIMKLGSLWIIPVLIALVIVSGCVGQTPENNPPSDDNGDLYTPPTGQASLNIISPENGEVIQGTTALGVRVEVENFKLSGTIKELRDNEGQIRAIVNGPVTKTQYTPYTTFSFTGLESGTYTLTVELVDNQKNSIGIFKTVNFEIQ